MLMSKFQPTKSMLITNTNNYGFSIGRFLPHVRRALQNKDISFAISFNKHIIEIGMMLEFYTIF